MITDNSTFRVLPDVMVSGEGQANFVTNLASGDVFELNSTARIAFDAAREGRTLVEVADLLQERYPDVSAAELHGDLQEVMQDLVRRGVLMVANE